MDLEILGFKGQEALTLHNRSFRSTSVFMHGSFMLDRLRAKVPEQRAILSAV